MSMAGPGLVRRTSSLSIRPPVKGTPSRRPARIEQDDEVIPDSEEERIKKRIEAGEVIDLIDSDEELYFNPSGNLYRPKTAKDSNAEPFSTTTPKQSGSKSVGETADTETESESTEDEETQPRYKHKTPKNPRRLRTIVSDSETESDNEMQVMRPGEDGVLVYDAPPSSRRPAPKPLVSPADGPGTALDVRPTKSGGIITIADPSPPEAGPATAPTTQAKLLDYFPQSPTKGKKPEDAGGSTLNLTTQSLSGGKPPGRARSPTKRKSKKALEQEKHEHLARYAQDLFHELNTAVFWNRLPAETAIIWNKRLAQTAGRAKWHIDRNRNETTAIELSPKVLDSEERVRNTLSHEMCHLASWYINRNPHENHGGVWRGWTEEVMEKRPDIEISTRHSYDIAYKYQWQCAVETCKRIYGRHSNSIDPKKSMCGVCKKGELVPLHKTRQKKEKAVAVSNMTSSKARDLPISAARARNTDTSTPTRAQRSKEIVISLSSDSEGTDIETDIDNAGVMIEPENSSHATITIRGLELGELDSSPRKASRDRDNEMDIDRSLGRRFTQMNIIDLTKD